MGKCLDCSPSDKEQPLIAGRCQSHYRIHRSKVNGEKKLARGVVPQPATKPDRKQGEGKKEKDPLLSKWFEYVATVIRANPYCMNCGEWIAPNYYRHASAHILPKSLFPSVATHPMNFLVLGAGCGCHAEFDHSIDKASAMRVWPLAVERFKRFEHLVLEKHKYLDLFKSKI